MIDSVLIPLSLALFLGLFVVAARRSRTPSRDCLACGRTVPDEEEIVDRPDLRVCQACIARGLGALHERMQKPEPEVSSATREQLRCNFCGTPETAATPCVCYPLNTMCRECLYSCQAWLQPDAPWIQRQRESRGFRDGVIALGFWVLLAGLLLAMQWQSCVSG